MEEGGRGRGGGEDRVYKRWRRGAYMVVTSACAGPRKNSSKGGGGDTTKTETFNKKKKKKKEKRLNALALSTSGALEPPNSKRKEIKKVPSHMRKTRPKTNPSLQHTGSESTDKNK